MSTRNTTTPTRARETSRRTTWSEAVLAILRSSKGSVSLSTLYLDITKLAPHLLEHNHHPEAKVRQQCQILVGKGLAVRVAKGVYAASRG